MLSNFLIIFLNKLTIKIKINSFKREKSSLNQKSSKDARLRFSIKFFDNELCA